MAQSYHLDQLDAIRSYAGVQKTVGLSRAHVERFLARDPKLSTAIDEAHQRHRALRSECPELLGMDEERLTRSLQHGILNFYDEEAVNPFVPLAARGPWIVTMAGAVIHDSGGYGMLGLGHSPVPVLQALAEPQVMANVMTPSLSQRRLIDRLRREIGHRRKPTPVCPFPAFVFLNSGSEANTFAARLADLHTRTATGEFGAHPNHKTMVLGLRGGFHGRTERPAEASDSSRAAYQALASFQGRSRLLTVPPNDLNALENVFGRAERESIYIEMMFMEPVMGEGNPGQAITPAFYALARRLTARHGTLLLVDSIQAAFRAHGCLSVVDYPGFEALDPPDMETYSKALNGGQFPLSVVALTGHACQLYRSGVYGNTMTGNPRGLEVASRVLDAMTPELRSNIIERGQALVHRLIRLAEELPGAITHVQGTGLLVAASLAPDRYRVEGAGGIEERLRRNGLGVIHGGTNTLRFTPHFYLTDDEIDLMIELVRSALETGAQAQ